MKRLLIVILALAAPRCVWTASTVITRNGFPGTCGTAGQLLSSNGDCTNTWSTPAASGPSSVVAGYGLTGGGSSGAVRLNLNAATTSYLQNTNTTQTATLDVTSGTVAGPLNVNGGSFNLYNADSTKINLLGTVTGSWGMEPGYNAIDLTGTQQLWLKGTSNFNIILGSDGDVGLAHTSASVAKVSCGVSGGTCSLLVSSHTASYYLTTTACASAGGTCGAAPSGFVTVAAAATTVTVNTTAVTANSQIFVQEDQTLATALSVTCNTGTTRAYYVTARTAGVSFQITSSVMPVTNPACLSYHIIN